LCYATKATNCQVCSRKTARAKSEELEIAYIVRGQKNIINRMKSLIETARNEVTVFISHPEVLKGLKEVLVDAKRKTQS